MATTLKRKCVFKSCNNFTESMVGLSYYKFPLQNPELCQKWVEITDTKDIQKQGKLHCMKVCSRHFEPHHFMKSKKQTPIRKKLKKDALPVEYIVKNNDSINNVKYLKNRKSKNIVNEISNEAIKKKNSFKFLVINDDEVEEKEDEYEDEEDVEGNVEEGEEEGDGGEREEESSTEKIGEIEKMAEEMEEELEIEKMNKNILKEDVKNSGFFSSSEDDYDNYSTNSSVNSEKLNIKKQQKDDNSNIETVPSKELVKVSFKDLVEYLRTNSLPEYWAWYYLDETIIFALVHKLLFRVKLKIIINSNLFVTICAPDRKAMSSLKSVTTISDLLDRLKYAEDLQVCTGLGIEGKSYSPNCNSFVKDSLFKQQKLPPRCDSCCILRKSYLL